MESTRKKPSKKATPNLPPKVANSMLQSDYSLKISLLEFNYKTYYEKFSIIMGIFSDSKNNNQLLIQGKTSAFEWLLAEVLDLLKQINSLGDDLTHGNYFNNNFILLKIKATIFVGKLLEVTSASSQAYDLYFLAMGTINITLKNIDFKSDFHFQSEVYYVYENASSVDKSTDMMVAVVNSFHKMLDAFQSKCGNNIINLRILYLQISGLLPASCNEKDLSKRFNDVFEKIACSFKKNEELNTINKLQMIEANYLKYNREISAHSKGIFAKEMSIIFGFMENEMKKNPPTVLIRFLESWTDWKNKYINPSMLLLKDLNLDQIKKNYDYMHYFYSTLMQWKTIFITNIKFFKFVANLPVSVGGSSIKLVNLSGNEVISLYDNIIFLLPFLQKPSNFLSKKMTVPTVEEVVREKEAYQKLNEKRNSFYLEVKQGYIQKVDERCNAFIEEEEAAAKLKREQEKDAEEVAVIPDQEILDSSSEDESSSNDNEAITPPPSCETLALLERIDEVSIKFSDDLLDEVNSVHKILIERVSQNHPFSKDKRKLIHESLEEIALKYNRLLKLYEENIVLSKKEEIQNKSEVQSGIQIGQDIILTKINEINLKIHACLKLLNQIEVKNSQNRILKKKTLALEYFELHKIDVTTLTEAQIMKRGELEFKRIGQEKAKREVSDYTHEKHFLNNSKSAQDCLLFLMSKMNVLNSSRSSFASQSLFQAASTITISDPEFQFFIAEIYFNQLLESKSNDLAYLKKALSLYERACESVELRGSEHLHMIYYKKAILKERLLNQPGFNEYALRDVINDYIAHDLLIKVSQKNPLIEKMAIKLAELNQMGNVSLKMKSQNRGY